MTADKKLPNYCFIDGANLYLGTQKARPPWKFDHKKLRIYLRDKYRVAKAYYFIGLEQKEHQYLYKGLRKSGYELEFTDEKTMNKGNADMDIVLGVMKKLAHEPQAFDKILLITNDGDFKQLVDHLIQVKRLAKLMYPDKRRRSPLYEHLPRHYIEDLSESKVRNKIELIREDGERVAA